MGPSSALRHADYVGESRVPTSVLRFLNGELLGQVVALTRPIVIGRASTADLFVPDRRISREHSRVTSEEGRLFIEDLQSHNGTYVNGQRITRTELFRGDTIRVGSTQLAIEAANLSETSAVMVVSDAETMQPRLVRPVEPFLAESISDLIAVRYFGEFQPAEVEQLRTREGVTKLLTNNRHFAILHEVSSILQRYTDLRERLPELLDLMLQVVGANRIALLVLDAQGQLVPRGLRHSDVTLNTNDLPMMQISKRVADAVLTERCAIITADVANDVRFATSDSIVLANIRSLMAVPVLVADRLVGLIELENTRSINGFDEADLRMVSIFASMLGVALDNLEVTEAHERTIAQLRAAQEQLLATQERLVASERMGTLGRLASGIAHEVKNHLSPFMLADMIARKYPKDEEIQEAGELMLEAQHRIVSLVDEIRAFARGSTQAMDPSPQDLSQLVDSVLRFVRCDRSLGEIDLTQMPGPRLVAVVDGQRIRQVLINLVRNAADAVPRPGGRVELRVIAQERDAIIQVIDNGSGVDPAIADRVFEPFFTTKGDKGLGLGLDLSRQIARDHGGTLTFESQRGVGTAFTLRLPLKPPVKAPHFDDMKTDPLGSVGLAGKGPGPMLPEPPRRAQ